MIVSQYRKLTSSEIDSLQQQMCSATDWSLIEVSEGFTTEYIRYTRFSGKIRLGAFNKEFALPGGMKKHSGLYHVTLHNVTIGDDCCIENVNNYIANYEIGNDTFIENVDIILVDGPSSFGNGVEVSVLNETGGREVMIYDKLSAQIAYVMALYRHRPVMVSNVRKMIADYVSSVTSSVGVIGSHVVIADTGYIKNVKIGDYCKIEGASRLKNGSINSNASAPVHLGVGVIGDDFIISSGSSVEDGVTFSRCFVGQACKLGHNYSASDSLFFSNCHGENGEACAIFAGPYTVTHHKSTLLIAGMFSFMNAGSGSNQSNHMYKLGPIHQGIMERGAKTASDSYILWPAKVGAFSLVMGRHVSHQDTSDLPFSYLIEQQSTSYIVPGANLKSVGTIRDAKKWSNRDKRTDPVKLDAINYNLLSPYTIQKMINGRKILEELQKVSGLNSDAYSFQSGLIRKSSLKNGLKLYGLAIDKFLGNSLITKLMSLDCETLAQLQEAMKPVSLYGDGDWVDIAGMIAPKSAVADLLTIVEAGEIHDIETLGELLREMHSEYYNYEWKWAYRIIKEYYGIDLQYAKVDEMADLVKRWRESVVALDQLIYEDARKEFSLSSMTSFGADGDKYEQQQDFMNVRGSLFEADPFVTSVKEHIQVKSALGDSALAKLNSLNK